MNAKDSRRAAPARRPAPGRPRGSRGSAEGVAMARTAVELPDPLENAGGGGGANSADDLLAQLAGDEVDRLLSEADATPPDPAHADRAAAWDEFPGATGTAIDELFEKAKETGAIPAA